MKLFGPSYKSLGPIERVHVENAIVFSERAQNDAMPDLILKPRPVLFRADAWITAQRNLPRVRGKLPRP